jgi:tetratricopeptide (TPR) repeat protein
MRTLIKTAGILLLAAVAFAQPPDTQLRYKVDYQCNGERVQVSYCRKDSDMAGFPPTTPQQNYCLVYYPDRPKRGGFTVQTSELRGAIEKKLQACGALSPEKPMNATSESVNQPAPSAGSAEAAFAEGEKNFQAKDLDKAVPFFLEAVRLKPDYANAWGRLGMSYYFAQQYKDALTAFQQCVRLVPGSADVEFMLGATYLQLGNKDAAVEAYKKLQSMNPAEAQKLYAAIQGQPAGPAAAAKPAPQPARPAAPPNAAIPLARQLLLLGTLNEQQGKQDEALANYRRAIEIHPDPDTLAMAYLNLGSLYADQKKYADAVSNYQESLRLQPKVAHTSYLLGVAYLGLGKKDEATKVYQNLLSLDKDEAEQLYRQIQNPK